MHCRTSEPERGWGGLVDKALYRETTPRGPTLYPFLYNFDRKGTPFGYLLLANMVPLSHTRSLTVGGRRIGAYELSSPEKGGLLEGGGLFERGA